MSNRKQRMDQSSPSSLASLASGPESQHRPSLPVRAHPSVRAKPTLLVKARERPELTGVQPLTRQLRHEAHWVCITVSQTADPMRPRHTHIVDTCTSTP